MNRKIRVRHFQELAAFEEFLNDLQTWQIVHISIVNNPQWGTLGAVCIWKDARAE